MVSDDASVPGGAGPDRLPTVLDRIDTLAVNAPGRIAVIDRGAPVTYAELALSSRRAAAWLFAQGIGPGDMVGISWPDELPHLLVCLALQRLGATQVTLAGRDPPAMRQAMAERLGVVAVVAGSTDHALPGCATLLPDPDAFAADAALDRVALPRVGPGACVLTSSGTTGREKLVLMTAQIMARQAALTSASGGVRHRIATNEFNNGKRQQLSTLWAGATEVLVNNRAGMGLAELCARFGVERLDIPPVAAERLLQEMRRPGAPPWPVAASVRLSGARVPGPLRAELQARLTRNVIVNLASTECGAMTLAGPDDHAVHPDTVGRPARGVELVVVDDEGRPCPAGEPGHLRVRSAACVDGYIADPVATALAFRDGCFFPGDMGYFLPDGSLVHLGRADDMMNLGSIKIFPAEIEAVAQDFPGVAECAAFAMRAPAVGDIPILAVVAAAGLDTDALLARCRARLGLRAPRRVVVVAQLPRNPQGKILRSELAALSRHATI
jgi:acyl-coenzyme A synthetase/AMP-(fatty) acid ligase